MASRWIISQYGPRCRGDTAPGYSGTQEVLVAGNDNSRLPELRSNGSGENWGSRIGVILAVAGSAVGLGNFLRFPGQATLNGGGVFMIPYFISLLLLGIPICWIEWTIGRHGGSKGFNSAPGIFSVLWRHPFSKYFGALALIVPVGIYMYYVYVEAWCLAYAWDYFTGTMAQYPKEIAAYKEHFDTFVGKHDNGFLLRNGAGLQKSVVFLVIVFIINFIFIYRGLTRGIELFCKWAMPILILFGVVVLVRVLTLGTPDPARPEANINNALGFMWNPKTAPGESIWTPLTNTQVWLAAAGQIFFSLSVGFGIVLNYASYLRKDDDVILSGLTATSTNEFCEVCLAGLITIPAAFIFLGAASLTPEVLSSSFELGFKALPAVFARMPAGSFFGALWFFMLFAAAITSSLSMLQPAIAFLEEGFGMGRKLSVTCLGMITAVGGLLVVYFSKDLIALDVLDFWVGTVCIFLLATIQVILVGWVFGIERTKQEASRGAAIRIPGVFWFVIKYVSPLYLLIIFAGWCYQAVPRYIKNVVAMNADDRGTVLLMLTFVVVLLVFFGLLVNLAGRNWRAWGKLPVREPEEALPVAAGQSNTGGRQ
ncbi:MAG: sodium-dependent transporter [Phycisphaerae bacterium]|jgi:NSS family neurotransmitter:Na+ symporter|nr:sodium-dependent transporter [Phycisphaerae bacterium]